jgi:sarcosine oxidase/L-pipecolate oxidase
MQLTPKEAAEYRNAPVVYNGDVGFFFEPNESVLIYELFELRG